MARTEDLLQAIENGDLKAFRELLETLVNNGDINSHKDKDGNTPMMIAAKYGHKEIVQLLLTKDVNNVSINAGNISGDTPLSYAAEYRHKDVVEILLQYTKNIWTPFYRKAVSRAAAKGHEDVLKMLLADNDIDSSEKVICGSIAIIAAAKYGKPLIVKHLLERGDSNLSPAACHEALIEGIIRGHIDVVKLLLKSNDIKINEADRDGRVPLIQAAAGGQTEIMEFLFMVEDINVNVRSNYQTALNMAMINDRVKVIELLFTREDLNLDAAGGSLSDVISWAYSEGHNDLAESILTKKCSELPGRTPLSWSAEKDEVDLLKVLLPEFDADSSSKANSKDHEGRTPLSRAAEKGHGAAVSLLMERNADVNLKDGDGRTPLWLAVENGHEDAVDELVPADTGTLLLLTQVGKLEAAIKLISHKRLIFDQKDNHGRTALHLAALLGHYDIARHLILSHRSKRLINSKDNSGETPLRLAIKGKHGSIVQELLNHKADTKDIEAKEWREAYNKPENDTILLSKTTDGEHYLDFPATFLSYEELSKTSVIFERRLYLLTDDLKDPIWSRAQVSTLDQKMERNILQTRMSNLGENAWTICISLQLSLDSYPDDQLCFDNMKISRVMWRMIQPESPGSPWTPIVYFSTLPYGWIPDNELHLFRQFFDHLRERWLNCCQNFERRLSDRRVEQLHSMGNKLEMINLLAKDAQQLAQLRSILASQTTDAEKFIRAYCLRFHREHNLQDALRFLKDEFRFEIYQRVENLDQSVRDLLQFEFAWTTIRETRIANKVGRNVMLLTYVSIFYLPLGFCAALWAIPNITDNSTRTPFILTATVVSLITLLVTFNMGTIAISFKQGYRYCRDNVAVLKGEKKIQNPVPSHSA